MPKRIAIELPDDKAEQLKDLARRHERTITGEARYAIVLYLRREATSGPTAQPEDDPEEGRSRKG